MTTILVLFLAAAVPASANAAETLALAPVAGFNVHEGHASAATEVLRSHLQKTGRFEVLVTPRLEAEPTPASAGALAKKSGASAVAIARIAVLGSAARVSLTAYDAEGRLRFSDELPAGSPEDLDPVLERLANAFAEGKSARENAELQTVTEREALPDAKQRGTSILGARLGGLGVVDRASRNTDAFLPGGGVFWLYDARSFLAELSFDFAAGESAEHLTTGLGAYYPLSRANMTPYVGGGLAWGWSKFGGEGANGLVLKAAGGVLYGRTSRVQLRGELGYFVNTFAEHESRRAYRGPAGPAHVNHGPMLSLGIGL